MSISLSHLSELTLQRQTPPSIRTSPSIPSPQTEGSTCVLSQYMFGDWNWGREGEREGEERRGGGRRKKMREGEKG